jgi:hypothetical protein
MHISAVDTSRLSTFVNCRVCKTAKEQLSMLQPLVTHVHLHLLAAACCRLRLPWVAWCTGGVRGSFLFGSFATAEAAARAHDRAVLALRQAGKAARAALNFLEADYAGEQLPAMTGAPRDRCRCKCKCLCACCVLLPPPAARGRGVRCHPLHWRWVHWLCLPFSTPDLRRMGCTSRVSSCIARGMHWRGGGECCPLSWYAARVAAVVAATALQTACWKIVST